MNATPFFLVKVSHHYFGFLHVFDYIGNVVRCTIFAVTV